MKCQLKQQIHSSYIKSNFNGRIYALQVTKKQSEESDGLSASP